MVPVEIKSGESESSSYFSGLTRWNEAAQANPSNGYVVYGGTEEQKRSAGNLIGWQKAGYLVERLRKE